MTPKTHLNRRSFLRGLGMTAALAASPKRQAAAQPKRRPNIVWVMAEDASPHIGCYGETTIQTPHLDKMAAEGIQFNAAFVTCPVCSPCRSAMATGMYQTTLGAHHHRSQRTSGKGMGGKDYLESYRLPVKLISQLFQEAGYHTTMESRAPSKGFGKTDYNFVWPQSGYDGHDWRETPDGKPFFAQIQLSGGKNRGAKQHATDPAKVTLPPYYPDHPVLREDWADYLNSWVQTDLDVGGLLADLEQHGVADNTIVFFLTDHGVSHLRGKQFLYEEGIHVPLLVRFPDGRGAGSKRDDLTIHIDLAPTSLALAGIPIPDHLQGVDLFAEDYTPRDRVFSARDRCDETPDIIRCVRTPRYKYIRNFLSHLPHLQHNQYKDGKKITQTVRALHEAGKLNELQARIFQQPRPAEELYDLKNDPDETVNLAGSDKHRDTLKKLRDALLDWMTESRDMGLIPEPILEELGKDQGNKYHVLRTGRGVRPAGVATLNEIIVAGEEQDVPRLLTALETSDPSSRYWAATGLGNSGAEQAITPLRQKLQDPSAGVRIAAALGLCNLGRQDEAVPLLIREIDSPNHVAGMYAIRALELSGIDTPAVRAAVKKAQDNPYNFTQRIAKRMTGNFTT